MSQTFLAVDGLGQGLLALEHGDKDILGGDPDPCALALTVVVRDDHRVLFGLNPWQCHWELPGGMIEPGEAPVAAAARELSEETGIAGLAMSYLGLAKFELDHPHRRELGAIYRADASADIMATVSEELVELAWVDLDHPPADMGPLDLAIARWSLGLR